MSLLKILSKRKGKMKSCTRRICITRQKCTKSNESKRTI